MYTFFTERERAGRREKEGGREEGREGGRYLVKSIFWEVSMR